MCVYIYIYILTAQWPCVAFDEGDRAIGSVPSCHLPVDGVHWVAVEVLFRV